MRRLFRLGGLLAIFVLVMSGCGDKTEKLPPLSKQDPKWSEYISMHSSGAVSRDDRLRIRFIHDIIEDDKIGKDAADVVEVTPSIAVTSSYLSKREIEIIPKEKLHSDQRYRVRVHGDKLNNIPKELGFYEFDVVVIKQQIDVRIEGISAASAQDPSLVLRGVLVTADTAEQADIEKILASEQNGKKLTIAWHHEGDNKHHKFAISGITRADKAGEMSVTWDGQSIGVKTEGKHKLEIPAIGDFKLVEVRAVQQDRNYIEVAFSDVIDSKQNLRGLIHVTNFKTTLQVEGSTVRVYTDKGFNGDVAVNIESGIRNVNGVVLNERVVRNITFAQQKPQVRFIGQGVVMPENQFLSIPFEAMNVKSVQVTALQVYDNNVGQFLQSNNLGGAHELQRVGRFLWRKTIKLDNVRADQWNRYALDASELLRKHPGALFQLTLAINRGNSSYTCSKEEAAVPVKKDPPLANNEDIYSSYAFISGEEGDVPVEEFSIVDDGEYEDYYQRYQAEYAQRDNPCNDAYYRYSPEVRATRNFMASNIGMLAKRGSDNTLHLVTTNLRSSEPLSGVSLKVFNFQNQAIGNSETDSKGMAKIELGSVPFYVVAKKGNQVGYLKVNAGSNLSVSHFDTGGEILSNGIKGIIYGERGVWRPGDDIFLTFVMEDKNNTIPENHPVTMELYNPKNQLMKRLTNSKPVGDFYTFKFNTSDKALTGNWQAKAILGGSTFTRQVKVETVMPNRLKVELDFGGDKLYSSDLPIKAKLNSQWLHGATAANLKADVSLKLSAIRTRFDKFNDYVFDDPSRKFKGESQVIFEGNLDAKGNAQFSPDLSLSTESPGMLLAEFDARVFEEGGAFSINSKSIPYSPFDHYVGMQMPKPEGGYGSLYLDTKYKMQLAAVDGKGEPVNLDKVNITIHRMDWRWWWDSSGDSTAQFNSALFNTPVKQDSIKIKNGRAEWEFELKGEEAWGRYLVRACDAEGSHCSGQVIYVDWPYWMGRSRAMDGVGASMLSFSADKQRYSVGETAKITLPEASNGRALVTVENGSRVLSARWVQVKKGNTAFELPLTAEMAPNVYVAVSLIQPHENKDNDRPIRLYGVIPLLVEDGKTVLAPKIKVADEWRPETDVTVEVSEDKGRPMTYTLAVVDEGLLGLTNFKTPKLHEHFYKKEALGVMTWDIFDEVVGAYGGELERMLSLGGGDEADDDKGKREKKRFPPVVKFLGAFELAKGETRKHSLKLPQYIGAVRVMAVAGKHGAYGSADKTVFVRQPLSMIATLPRVIGPEEELLVPVSLFAMDKSIKQATLTIETNDLFEVVGDKTTTVNFKGDEEQLGFLKLKVKDAIGKGYVKFTARSGDHQTKEEVYIDVRTANQPSTRFISKVIAPGQSWSDTVVPHGLAGTNRVMMEVSLLPPINLDNRLQYLIQYPHGCVEQVTSSVFPQLYLPKLIKLTDAQKARIQDNVHAGIQRLRQYQNSQGGFVYWPGYSDYDRWASNYAGHFLVEANKLGYHVPPEMLSQWLNHQRNTANNWVVGTGYSEMDQSYRLYTLALAGKPELGAMNRLRENKKLNSVARWQLAAAYNMAGLPDIAKEVVRDDKLVIDSYIYEGWSYGSVLRDRAVILEAMSQLGYWEQAKPIADEIAKELSAERWHSTQTVAFSLLSLSRFVGKDVNNADVKFAMRTGEGAEQNISINAPIYLQELEKFPNKGDKVVIRNPTERNLYVTLSLTGVPKSGTETESNKGLIMDVRYTDGKGIPVDISKLPQGSDIIARVRIRNHTDRWVTNLALTQVVPSGWQIHNARLNESADKTAATAKNFDYQDIRDDRVYTYFRINHGEEKEFQIRLNASYLGRYYAPGVSVEAMYDAKIHARSKGQWVEVVKQDKP